MLDTTHHTVIDLLTVAPTPPPPVDTPVEEPFAVMQAGLAAREIQRLLEEALDHASGLSESELPSDLRIVVRRLGDELHSVLVAADLLDDLVLLHERTLVTDPS